MKYTKVIAIMSLTVLTLLFSSFDTFDYDKAWKKVDEFIEKGLPKSALKEVKNIFEHATKDKNIPQQIKSVTYKTKLIFQTEELGLETVVAEIDESIAKAGTPAKEILYSLAGELMSQYFRSNYYSISQRTNLSDFDTGDIRTWAPNNFRSYISSHYLSSVDEKMKEFSTVDFKDIVVNFKKADISLRPTLYELLLDRALSYFSNTNRQGIKPSFSFKINDPNYYSSVEEFVNFEIETEDKSSNLYQAILLFQDALRLQLKNGNRKVLADYDLKRLEFVNQYGEISKSNDLYIGSLNNAVRFYEGELRHPFQIKIGLDYRNKKEYQKAIDQFNLILNDNPSEHTKSVIEKSISSIKAKTLNTQVEQVIPIGENFLLNVSSRNLNDVYFKLLDAKNLDFSKLFSGNREDQRSRIDALPVIRRWHKSNVQDGYNHSSYEEIVDGLSVGKYVIVSSNTEKFKSDESAYVFSAFFVSDIAHSTYDMLDGKTVSVRNRKTGKPIHNATIEVFSKIYNRKTRVHDLELLSRKTTDKQGFALFNIDSRNAISYTIKNNSDILDIEQLDYRSRLRKREYRKNVIEIFSDRAIYRPGQTFHFKALGMKIDNEGVPSIAPNKKFTAILKDANGEEVDKIKLTGNEYGSVSGSFTLPAGRLTGQYSVRISDDSHGNSHYFRVEEYKRPKFEVKLNDIDQEIKLGDNIKIEGNAKALSGAPVSNGKVSYVITKNTYHGWWSWYRGIPNSSIQISKGEIKTDIKGDFNFNFDAIPDEDLDASKNPSYTYSVNVDVTDQAGETRSTNKSLSVSVFPYSYAWNLNEIMDISELSSINISPTTIEGQKVKAKGTLIISELVQSEKWMKPRKWKYPSILKYEKGDFEEKIDRIAYKQSRMSDYPVKSELLRIDVEYSEKGLNYKFGNVLTAGKAYKIELISEEKYRDLNIKDTKYIAVTDLKSHNYPNLELLYSNGQEVTAEIGKPHTITLGTCDQELTAYYQVVRDWEVLEDGMLNMANNASITYTPKSRDRGGYSVIIDYVKHNFRKRIKYDIKLPWDNKDLKVELITKREKVLPGSKEEWMLKISGAGKDKIVAEMLATMYDASLDQFVKHSYSFNPYLNHYGNIHGRFFGFDFGLSGNLNFEWARGKYKSSPAIIIPKLKGINLGNRGYGINTLSGVKVGDRNILVRGSAKRSSMDGDVPMSAPMAEPAMAMDESDSSASNFEALEGGGSGTDLSNKSEENEIAVRKNLNESVFFYPHLKTDTEGNILLSFTMNEALTKWKLLTFAHDKELRFGMTSHEVKTQKDLMIVPNSPRFLREGDRLIFPATISNLSESSIEASANLELFDPITNLKLDDIFNLKALTQNVNIPEGESARVDWEVVIPQDYKGMVKYRVTAKAGQHTDGEENVLPVVTNQTLVTETKIISLRKKETKAFEFSAVEKSASTTSVPFKYTLEYTSNPIWYAVQALPYLMEYPHNCTEQIFNRMYANTMASYIANQNPKIKAVFDQWKSMDSDALLSNLEKNESLKSAVLEETPWVRQAKSETEQKKRIALLFDLNKMSNETKQVLEELNNRQLPSGAFPWFTGGREDVYITQNVLEGIAHLQHLGIISQEDYQYMNIVDKALIYLDEQSKKRYDKILENQKRYGSKLADDHLSNISIHYLYIRSFFKDKQVKSGTQEAYDYFLEQSEKYWLGKGLYSEAIIGLILKRNNNSEYTKVLASLKERSFYSEELGRYWNIGSGFNWYELPIESHAMLIEFFTEVDKDGSYLEDMKIWLLKNKQTNHWKTTKGTAAAIYALLIQGESSGMIKWIEEDNSPSIKVGNTSLKIDKSNLEAGTGYFQKTWIDSEITEDLSEITIENRNETIAWGAAYYQYFEDLDKVKDFRDTPLQMKRKLFKEVKTDNGPELIEINELTQLAPGDRTIVRIEIKVDRSMSYVHLKDMRSSGFEPENVLSGYRWKGGLGYYESTKDLASHFFISHLNKGTYVFEYPMRVVHKGDFSTGIATIQCMYAPEFTSHSEGGRVEVK